MAEENTAKKQGEHQISIQIDSQTAPGVYSNFMMISHRKDEFVLDFLFVQPQGPAKGQSIANLRARIISAPGHAKRILRALDENIRRYEQHFGPIEEAVDFPKVMH